MTTRSRVFFWKGVVDCSPLFLSTIPFALIFGLLAYDAGLGLWAGQGFSAIIFAGSAQFAAADAYRQGASVPVIVTLIFLLNARHLLYALDLAARVRHWSTWTRLGLGYFLTDEAYAIMARRLDRYPGEPLSAAYALGAGLALFIPWNIFTFLGIFLAAKVEILRQIPLSIMIYCAYIAIFIPMVQSWTRLFAMLCALGFALIFRDIPYQMGLVLAALLAIVLGLGAESWWQKQKA